MCWEKKPNTRLNRRPVTRTVCADVPYVHIHYIYTCDIHYMQIQTTKSGENKSSSDVQRCRRRRRSRYQMKLKLNWSWSWLPIALVRDRSPSVLTPPQLETYSPCWEDAHAPVKCERNDRWSVVTAYRPDVRQWISLAMTISADFGALIIWVDIIRRHSGRQSRRQSRSSISRRHSYGSSVRCVTQSWPPEPPSPPKHDLSQNTSESPRGLRTRLKCIVRVHTRHRA